MPQDVGHADTLPAANQRESYSPNAIKLCSDGNGGVIARFPKSWWAVLIAFALGGGSAGNVLARFALPEQPYSVDRIRAIEREQADAARERALTAAAVKSLVENLSRLREGQDRIADKMDGVTRSANLMEGWIAGKRDQGQ